MRCSRRHFLKTVVAWVPAVVVPIAPAQAQWQLEIILKALTIISTGLNILGVLEKWFPYNTQDKRCSITVEELENIKLYCDMLAQTLDDETIPLLKNFLVNKDKRGWMKVKISVAQLLADGTVLMENIDGLITKLDPKTYPGPKEDIERLYHGVDDIRAAIVMIERLPDSSEPEDFTRAENVLNAILPIPELARTAATRLPRVIDDRQKENCQ